MLDATPQVSGAEIELLLKNYLAMTPRVRSKARDVFFSRKEWARRFLDDVTEKTFPSNDVPLDQLQKIALLRE